MLVSLRVVARVSTGQKSAMENVHSSKCLCNDASDNVLEENSVLVIEEVGASREEEVQVQKPASAIFAVAVHEVRNCGKVVEVEGPCEPRTTWSRHSFRFSQIHWWVDQLARQSRNIGCDLEEPARACRLGG